MLKTRHIKQQIEPKSRDTSLHGATTLVNLCFFLDVLTPDEFLSLSFQKDFADPVSVVNALTKAFNKLQRLKEKSVREFPSMKFSLTILKRVKTVR